MTLKIYIRNILVRIYNTVSHSLFSNSVVKYCILSIKSILYAHKRKDFDTLLSFAQKDPDSNLFSSIYSTKIIKLIEKNITNRISSHELASLLYGSIVHRKTGLTPQFSHNAFINLYEKTNGLAQDLCYSAFFANSCEINLTDDLLSSNEFVGDISPDAIQSALSIISKDGYAVMPFRLSPDFLDNLLSETKRLRFCPDRTKEYQLIDPVTPPICNIAPAHKEDLESSPLLSSLCSHPLLLAIASISLQSNVQVVNKSLWYSFPAKNASSRAAQFFHYDLDSFRWLKLFIYLTDVIPTSGPHEYVKGTHVPGSKVSRLLLRNYSRLEDVEIDRHYQSLRESLTAPKGSLIFGDTRCFHKGQLPTSGYRLVLQPVYAPSTYSLKVR